MFYICYIDLYNKGSYELIEYFCRFYKKEIRIVFYEFDSALNIVIELPDEEENYSEESYSEDEDSDEEYYSEDEDSDEEYYSEDHRLNEIIKYHSQNFKSNFWSQPGFCKLSDDEYYELIEEIVDGPDEDKLPKVFIFLKNGGQIEDFVLNETFKRLIKMSLHFTSSEESKIREWNINFREYCENDFKEFVNYCFTTYPEYDNDNVDLKKLYLLDQTLNGLHQILH